MQQHYWYIRDTVCTTSTIMWLTLWCRQATVNQSAVLSASYSLVIIGSLLMWFKLI
jgi:hypothetical protein